MAAAIRAGRTSDCSSLEPEWMARDSSSSRAASLVGDLARRRPRWEQIQDEIECAIRQGKYGPGDQLPTEEELAQQFRVHRHTVRRAIERLRDDQVLRVEQGRGIFVRERAVSYRLGRDTRLTIAALRDERRPSRRILSSMRIKAERSIATALTLPLHHPVQRVNMVRLVDDRVISVASCYYPLPRFQGITRIIRATGSISEAIRQFGVTDLPRKSLRINAAMPTAKQAELLNISRQKPLLELLHVNVDHNGIPVQAAHSFFASTWLDLVIEF